MKFRYYITSLFSGKIEGTDDAAKAEEYSQCEDFFVVDSETGEWLTFGERLPVEKMGE